MTHETPLALVGNALAVLVAATERARAGLRTLVVNPGGSWGGYFAGVQAGGRRWDAGMVLYEFTSLRTPAAPPPLASYDPMRRYDVARFCATVQNYVQAQHAVRDIAPPQMWTGDRVLPDLLLANGLDALPQLACADAAQRELRACLGRGDEWHASRKLEWPAEVGYDCVARLNHGHVLHDAVFAPFARKVLASDAASLPAAYHRIPWLPLYWPQTLLSWLEARPQVLPPTVFSHPHGACVADLCAGLVARMDAAPAIARCRDRVLHVERHADGFVLQLEHGGRVRAARLGWALTPRQGLAACGETTDGSVEPRLPITLVFLRIDASALRRRFSVLHLIDSNTGCYRVSNTSECAGESHGAPAHLVVEAHSDHFAACHGPLSGDAAVVRAALADLVRCGTVARRCTPSFAHVLRLPGALPLPTAASLGVFADERATLQRKLPGVELLGASAGPFATALSDQIVQGLQLARADLEHHPDGALCAA